MLFIKLNLLVLLTTGSIVLHANSGGGEGGEGGGEGAAAPVDQMSQDEKDFIGKTTKLTTLTNRISEAEKHFNELVKKKAALKTPEEKHPIIKEMVEVTNQRNKDVEEYNQIRSDLNLRYPSQGKQLDRRYHIQNKRSLEELEGVAGLDEMLTRTRKQVERKYAPLKGPEDDKKKAPSAAAAQPEEEKPKRLRLEK